MKTVLRSLAPWLTALVIAASAGSAHAQALYWIDANYAAPTINKSDANGLVVTSTPLYFGTLPEGLAVSATSGKLYWAEAEWANARINQMAPTVGGVILPVVTSESSLRGIAIDDTTRLMYWASSHLGTGAAIYRSNLDGTGVSQIALLGPLANPRGITVDHNGGKIYWTDFDQNAIYSANLDGTAATVWFALTPGTEPYGIVVDPMLHTLYWSEYGMGRIQRSSTFGPSPLLLYAGLFNPTYLALDRAGARLFWIDSGAGSQHLKRVPTAGGPVTILPPTITTYGGLAFQPNVIVGAPTEAPPTELAFERAWPSPSRGTVHFAFALPRAAHARLVVLDLQGREVAVLADDALPPGRYERQWDARAGARTTAAGVYFARLSVEGRRFVQRLALVR